MKYLIKSYEEYNGTHTLKNLEDGKQFRVDLFVDSSFENCPINIEMSMNEVHNVCHGLVGKTIEVLELCPVEYFAQEVKIIG